MSVAERVEKVRVNGIDLALHTFEPRLVAPQGIAEPVDHLERRTNRKTVLLLHGFLDAAATWDLVAAPLARSGLEVLALDFRGFGESGRVPEGGYYHFPDYVADLDALVRALDRRWLALVAHSMGGGVGALFTGARPELVQRLVILEGLGPIADAPALAVDRMRRWLADLVKVNRAGRTLASAQDALDRLAATHPRINRELLRSRAERLVKRAPDGSLTWAWDPLHRTTSPTPFSSEVFASFLRAIACPTLFIGGGPSGWHPPDEAERLACIPKLERIDLEGAGHMMHWTAPDQVAAAVLSFIEDRKIADV